MDEFRRTTKADIEAIASNARQCDVFECYYYNGKPFVETLADAVRYSRDAQTWFHNAQPTAIWGVASLGQKRGVPWLLGSKAMDSFLEPRSLRNKTRFMKHSRNVLLGWQDMYDQLENWVWKENKKAVAWLERLGFEVLPAEPFGKFREPFHKFRWSSD